MQPSNFIRRRPPCFTPVTGRQHNRPINLALQVAFSLAATLAASACSSGASSAGSGSPMTAETPNRVPAITTVSDAPAVATSSFSTPPTMRILSDEDAVHSVYGEFLTMIAVVADPPNPDHPLIAATTTGPLLVRVRDALVARRDAGRRGTGGFRSSIMSVQVGGDDAWVLDCALDESVGYSPTGEPGVVATEWFVRSARVIRTTAGWRVSEFVTGDPCEAAS